MADPQFPDLSPQLPSEWFVDPLAGVDPISEDDRQRGTRSQPFKTLSYALQQAAPGTVIYLQPGRYETAQGERFPLQIPPEVVIVGDVTARGGETAIVGGGNWESATFGNQNIALVMAEMSQVRGVTVTNPHPKGTGIWVEAAAATIAHCRLNHCGREGIFVTGEATPIVLNCWFLQNRASGITFTRYAKGEIQRSLFCQNRFGLTLSDFASPLIYQSEITENQVGLVLSGASRPVLRENRIAVNQEGMVTFSQAVPDLGDRQSPGKNYFQDNTDVALRNVGSQSFIAAGNLLHPQLVRGAIEFRALQPMQSGSGGAEIWKEIMQPRIEPSAPNSVSSPVSETPIPPDLIHHWSLPFVSELLSRRIMGCFAEGTFQPDRPVSRAQFAALIVRAFQQPERFSERTFRDVPAGYWTAEPIAKAVQMGFVEPEGDGLFYPEQPLSRWQAIVGFVKGLGLKGGSPHLLRSFRDRAEIPSIAVSAVATAVAHRLLVLPQQDRLAPLLPVTRAEIAAWIYQASQGKANLTNCSESQEPIAAQGMGQNSVAWADLSLPNSTHQASRLGASGDAVRVAIDLDIDRQVDPEISSERQKGSFQAGFWVAAQVAERLEQKGIAAKLIQSWDCSIAIEERLTMLQEIQPTLLLQIHLVAISNAEAGAIGIQTAYAPAEVQPVAAMLHRTLLTLLDLPDRNLSPFPEFPYPIAIPIFKVEFGLLAETLNQTDGIDRSFCSYLAQGIQQGLLACLAV